MIIGIVTFHDILHILFIAVMWTQSGVFEIRDYSNNMDVAEKVCQGCLQCYIYASFFQIEDDKFRINDIKKSANRGLLAEIVILSSIGKRSSLIRVLSLNYNF